MATLNPIKNTNKLAKKAQKFSYAKINMILLISILVLLTGSIVYSIVLGGQVSNIQKTYKTDYVFGGKSGGGGQAGESLISYLGDNIFLGDDIEGNTISDTTSYPGYECYTLCVNSTEEECEEDECIDSGGQCTYDEDCCEGCCKDMGTAGFYCTDEQYCEEDECVQNGLSCQTSADCCYESECVDGMCCDDGDYLAICETNSDCCSDCCLLMGDHNECRFAEECDACVQEGISCVYDNDCCEGACTNGICGEEQCQQAQQSCQTNEDCCDDLNCDNGVCCEGLPYLGSCSVNEDCCSGCCNGYECRMEMECPDCQEWGGACFREEDCCEAAYPELSCNLNTNECEYCGELQSLCGQGYPDCCSGYQCNPQTNMCDYLVV
ncbi:MAG: hypothetical protein ABIH76_08405 [Candidatus Bathyarchaeota archaeon]